MKKYILLFTMALLSFGCNAQADKAKKDTLDNDEEAVATEPKGSWKVDKEYDENGNLIRYDSIYSWSSYDHFDNFSSIARDSLIQSYKSRFFSGFSDFENDGFDTIFSQDSLFSSRFFNDDFFGSRFGKDFMDIDKMRQQLLERQMRFLEKYQSEFIKPEDEN
ncbi:hypothetical protein [Hanstruepera flava]|uniref:hypothetical protein n=1 Tax=Hanstruepera flava TaxID=2930218 RepID=UPI002027ADC8|nr:hypothetical protein [Hanstruepera flava]